MEKLKSIAASLVTAGAMLAWGQGALAATLYVAPTGSDSNSGSATSPFLTLQKSVNAAAAGDTIIVRDGTYGCPGSPDSMAVNINKAGNSSAWITLKAENKGKAILDGKYSCHSYFNLGSASAYWIIDGFEIRYARWGGVWSNAKGGKNFIIRNNHIHHMGNRYETGLCMVGVFFDIGGNNVTLDRNLFHDVGRTNQLSNGFDHAIYTHAANSVITNNVIYNSLSGHHIQTAAGFSGTIANNTFFGPSFFPSRLSQVMLWGSNGSLVIRNNVFYDTRTYGLVTYNFTLGGSCTIDHNIVYKPGGSVSLINALAGCTASSNLINVDPKLVKPSVTGYDFHLQSVSPAINSGAPVSGLAFDYDGVPRPQGPAYDMGAYEYGGTVPVPSVDVTPPSLSAVAASSIGQNGATIGWTTNEPADTQVEYGPTTAYGASTALNATLSMSHSAALSGLTAGTLYHYRIKSKDAAGNLATSPDATFTTLTTSASGCLTSAGTWQNAPLAAQTGAFSVEFDAVPGTANIDAVNGLSNGAASGYSALAAVVRFNNAGTIDARNGSAYGAAVSIPYVAGLSYHFRLVVNLAARTYSAYVKQGANAEQMIGGSYAFRTEQAGASTLNNLGLFASVGSEQVCAVAVKGADAGAPVISSVAASAIGQNGATIGWTTNEPADTQVEYGPTTAYGASTPLNAVLALNHGAALSALTAGTLYHYRVKSKDAAGNLAVSGDFTFTTAALADVGAPVITSVAVSGAVQNGATIGWITNEPADTQVEYGPTAAYGASTVLNSALTTSHAATLSGLTAGTLYHYRVKSKDGAGNLATSADATFTTAATAPGAGCMSSAGAWQNAALSAQTGAFTVEFDAVPGAASIDGVSGLSNGPAANYTALAVAVRFNNAGTIDARNGGAYAAAASIPYVGGLTYHFRLVVNLPARTYSAYVKQGANAERLVGGSYAFRSEQAAVSTLNNAGLLASSGSEQVCAVAVAGAPADTTAPVISAVAASAVSQTGATIVWTTNEPADTQVEYGPTTAYGASTALNETLAAGHSAALSGLTAGVLYHYRVKSKDAAGNLATSADAVFTTAAAAPAACVSSAGTWANSAIASQSGTFVVEFDGIPGAGNVDSAIGLSRGAASDYAMLAAIVRFNPGGTIDARDAGAYKADSVIPYISGLTYHFRLEVSLSARKYSAYVKQGADVERLIGANFTFRTEQSGLSTINNVGMLASAGSAKLCGAAVK